MHLSVPLNRALLVWLKDQVKLEHEKPRETLSAYLLEELSDKDRMVRLTEKKDVALYYQANKEDG